MSKATSETTAFKPALLVIIYFLFLCGTTAVAYFVSLTIQQELANSISLHLEKDKLISEQIHSIHTRHLLVRDILLEEDPFTKDEMILKHNEYARRVLKSRKTFEELPLDPAERALIDSQWRDSRTGYSAQSEFIERSLDAELDARMQLYHELVAQTQSEFLRRMDDMSSYQSDLRFLSNEILEQAKQKQVKNWFMLLVFYMLTLFIGGAAIVWLYLKLRQRHLDLQWQGAHDNLTGLINRQEFEYQLHQIINHDETSDASHSLLYLDLDHFKHVNDSCGHLAGDTLLIQLKTLLLKHTGPEDMVARFGGDEFGILLKNTSMNQARLQADQLRQDIYELPFKWQNKNFNTSVSIGLVAIDPSEHDTQNILKHADIACFHAKDLGGNRVHTFVLDDRTSTSKIRELDRVNQIKRALADNQLILYQQDITSIHDGQSKFSEILVRMVDEHKTTLPPAKFLPIAERYRLIGEIDFWVLRYTCQYILDNDNSDRCYSINISGETLNDEQSFDRLYNEIRHSEIDASRLIFEITETSAISNLTAALKFIQDVKTLGCRFALDDFGSGLCSFNYLKQIPVDFIKIDGSFIYQLKPDSLDYAVVKAIQYIASNMGVKTVAEWVENKAVLEHVKELGIDYAQGHYLGAPKALI